MRATIFFTIPLLILFARNFTVNRAQLVVRKLFDSKHFLQNQALTGNDNQYKKLVKSQILRRIT
jgi:hypothetical protein